MGTVTDEATTILSALGQLVEPLASVIPGDCEVVLHDLSLLPNSIVAISGDLTGRTIGSPSTDRLLRAHARKEYRTEIGYYSMLPDGRQLCCSTMIFRDSADVAVAALCVNSDTRNWRLLAELANSMMPAKADAETGPEANPGEEFLRDVDELASKLLGQAIANSEIPVGLMHKVHKIAVVQDLRDRGFFMLKESVERAANALGVTRFTIYNYLNELESES
ncbi:MAG: PAS domain-containing protein [Propionibacteriaceae bacterium]|nr:PAS domain-containing protein [Propionibacteriaceae bacterium]